MARENDRNYRKKRSGEAEPNPMKQVSLTPMELRSEAANPMESQPFEARETPLVSFGEHASPAKHIQEHRFDVAPTQERRPELKQEHSPTFQLRPIIVTPVEMQQLQERRVDARDLGWVVPGHRIRIGT